MVSLDAAASSGAKGIAREAGITAKPKPIANSAAARIFMNFSCQYASKIMIPDYNKSDRPSAPLTSGGDASGGDASGVGASPNDAGANACASGGDASALAQV
jgi:hypothetical protein